jgi:uncharacterized protein (TIGR02996 family)
MRRYEFKEGSSNKFWEIAIEGESFTTKFGKIGTDGQTATKEFDSAPLARSAYDKIIAEKEKKGYKLVSADDGATAASNAELEAAIVASPVDPAPYLVYGDWLQAQGDPRGELIAVQAALLDKPKDAKLKKKEQQLLSDHQSHLLGDLMDFEEGNGELAVEWYLGFLKSISVGGDEYGEIDAEGAIRTALKLPSAKFMREIVIGVFDTEDGQPEYAGLLKTMSKLPIPQTLRRLAFDIGSFQISWSKLGNVSLLYPQLGNLEELLIKNGAFDLGKMSLPNLKKLDIVTGGFTKANMASVANAKLPKLESLCLYFGDENYGANCTIKDVKPVLDGKGFERVKHLGLCNAEFENDIAKAMPTSKIVKQLETLDLSKGQMTDEGAEALIAGAKALSHLKRIDVSHNFLSDAMQKKLKKALPKIEIGDQEKADGDYRYVQVAE